VFEAAAEVGGERRAIDRGIQEVSGGEQPCWGVRERTHANGYVGSVADDVDAFEVSQ
jgi:hypothetical protein